MSQVAEGPSKSMIAGLLGRLGLKPVRLPIVEETQPPIGIRPDDVAGSEQPIEIDLDGVTSAIGDLVEAMRSTDRLHVLQQELSECRSDDRASFAMMVTVISAGTALYGLLFYALFGIDGVREDVPQFLWAYLPTIPFGLTGWWVHGGQQLAVRSEYQLRLERQIWTECPVHVAEAKAGILLADTASSVPVPAMAHLWEPHIRLNGRGHWTSRVMLSLGVAVLASMVALMATACIMQIHLVWLRAVIGAVYGIAFVFGFAMVALSFGAPHRLWAISKAKIDVGAGTGSPSVGGRLG